MWSDQRVGGVFGGIRAAVRAAAPPTTPHFALGAGLPPEQKKALNKIAKGEVLDVKVSGLEGIAGADSAGGNAGKDGGAEEAGVDGRSFVAFNIQLRTLRWVPDRSRSNPLEPDRTRSTAGAPRRAGPWASIP